MRSGVSAGVLDWSIDSDASAGTLTTETGSSGFVGSVGYDYFVRDDLAVGLTAGVLDSESSTSVGVGGISSRSASVVPILFRVTYYPEELALGSQLRPYVSGSFGPYLGSATNSLVGPTVSSESISEVALGMRVAGGVDWFVSRNVKLGFGVGYHLVGDFDERIGSTDNYSGLELSVGLGILFGKGGATAGG